MLYHVTYVTRKTDDFILAVMSTLSISFNLYKPTMSIFVYSFDVVLLNYMGVAHTIYVWNTFTFYQIIIIVIRKWIYIFIHAFICLAWANNEVVPSTLYSSKLHQSYYTLLYTGTENKIEKNFFFRIKVGRAIFSLYYLDGNIIGQKFVYILDFDRLNNIDATKRTRSFSCLYNEPINYINQRTKVYLDHWLSHGERQSMSRWSSHFTLKWARIKSRRFPSFWAKGGN